MILAAVLLTGCNPARLLPGAAAEEQSVTVYTALDPVEAQYYLKDFAIAHPEIAVNLVSLPVEELRQRLMAERANPQADVLWGISLTNMLMFEWEDLLRPYAPEGLERVDLRYRDARTPPNWVGTHLDIAALCISPEGKVTTPSTLQDLIDPQYRRSIIMPSPLTSPAGLMFVVDVLVRYGELDGWRYLDDLNKNITMYTKSDEGACRLVSQGEYPIGISRYLDNLSNLKYVYPRDRSAWRLYTNALVRKNPSKRAAEAFLDWSISEVAMRLYIRKAGITTIQTGFAPPRSFPAHIENQLQPTDLPWAAANLTRILTEWQRRYGDKVEK